MEICKEIFFYGGGGTPLPESQIFLDILGKNLVIFYNFSRFIYKWKNKFLSPKYVSVMYEKKKFLKFQTF